MSELGMDAQKSTRGLWSAPPDLPACILRAPPTGQAISLLITDGHCHAWRAMPITASSARADLSPGPRDGLPQVAAVK
jgi:hypothetical protein